MWNSAVIDRFADLWTNLATRLLADAQAGNVSAAQDTLLWPNVWRFGQRHSADVHAWWQALPDAPDTDEPTWSAAPASCLAATLCRWLRDNDQFGHTYDQTTRKTAQAFCRNAMQACIDALCEAPPQAEPPTMPLEMLRAGADALLSQSGAPAPSAVVCSEYSAALQLQILGLEPQAMLGPVLDVGCGEQAHLVQSLRAAGVDAFGIDPLAQAPGALAVDWHACDFGRQKWGTILSHQAFSLHFLHHHLLHEDKARAYAQTYMRMLQALRPGGVLAYAPGLPFIEALLPAERYVCTPKLLPKALQEMPQLTQLQQFTGLSLAYAMHVRVRVRGD